MLIFKPTQLLPVYVVALVATTSPTSNSFVVATKAIFEVPSSQVIASKLRLRNLTNVVARIGLQQTRVVGIDEGKIETYVELAPRESKEVALLGLVNQIHLVVVTSNTIEISEYETLVIPSNYYSLLGTHFAEVISTNSEATIDKFNSMTRLVNKTRVAYQILGTSIPYTFNVYSVQATGKIIYNLHTTIYNSAVIVGLSNIYLSSLLPVEINVISTRYEKEFTQKPSSIVTDTSNLEIWT
jgi:hypothetical protein